MNVREGTRPVDDAVAVAVHILRRYAPYLLSRRVRRRRFRCDGQLRLDLGD